MAVQDRLFNSSIAIAAGRSDCAGSLADEAPESAHQVSSSNGFCLILCGWRGYKGNIRARRSSGPARPYMARLRVFNRLICPSV
jgi:hypothetical protein